MKASDPRLLLRAAPLLHQSLTTATAMREVILALLPAILAALWFFGLGALLLILTSVAGALATEWLFTPPERRIQALSDGSGVLTGLLLALSLPPGLPLWMAFLGAVVGMGLGKVIWGGLGGNWFNPALIGRAFLLGTFPIAMTTWHPPQASGQFFQLLPGLLTPPFLHPQVHDALSSATPLGLMKFEHQPTGFGDLLLGSTAGSLGETSGLLLLLGGIYLLTRRIIDWRIPLAIFASAALFASLLYLTDGARFPGPWQTLFSGGLMLGAIYMATDPVTSPMTPLGIWIFGVGIGVLVVLIRVFGGLPEGVMYAILLMNAATPLIDRLTQPRVFGRGRARS